MKRWIIGIGAALLPVALLIAVILYLGLRPADDSVKPEAMQHNLMFGYMGIETAAGYCELEGSEEFAALFCVAGWDKVSFSPGDPVAEIRFAEEYHLYLYADGSVQAHDGYASPERKGSVYYKTRLDMDAVLQFIQSNGHTEGLRLRYQG